MRILILNPNSDQETHELLQRVADDFLQGRACADVVSMKSAPKLIVTYEDQAAAAAEMVQVVRAKKDDYDGFVLACHGDPNLDLLQELTGKPTYGIAQASMKIAAMKGDFAVLTPSENIISKKFALARKYQCQEQLKVVQVSSGNGKEELLDAGREALKTPGVQAVVLGCANYAGNSGWLEKRLGVPVLDGLTWALALVESEARIQNYNRKQAE